MFVCVCVFVSVLFHRIMGKSVQQRARDLVDLPDSDTGSVRGARCEDRKNPLLLPPPQPRRSEDRIRKERMHKKNGVANLPLQVLGGGLATIRVRALHFVHDALQLRVPLVALLFQLGVLHQRPQIGRNVVFAAQPHVLHRSHVKALRTVVVVRGPRRRCVRCGHLNAGDGVKVAQRFGQFGARTGGVAVALPVRHDRWRNGEIPSTRLGDFTVEFGEKLADERLLALVLAIDEVIVGRVDHLDEGVAVGELPQVQGFAVGCYGRVLVRANGAQCT